METSERYNKLHKIASDLLQVIDEDPNRPGVRDTPRRVAKYWQEFIEYDPGTVSTVFEAVRLDQMVVVSNIRVWSLCEHHLLPFWCDISVGYITRDHVIGVSKIPRICQKYAHRLQLQERLVDDIATEISTITKSPNVAVVGRGVHTCMVMRGVKSDGVMVSSVMRGEFKHHHEARMEFLELIKC